MANVTKLTTSGVQYAQGFDEVTFNTNVSTLDYKNLYSQSQNINLAGAADNRWWGNGTMSLWSANSAIAPDGTQTAWTVSNVPNLACSFANPNIAVIGNFLAKANTIYTKSIYAKYVKGSPFFIFQLITYDQRYIAPTFNLQTGVVSGTSTSTNWGMTYVGDGWWRCWGSFNSGTTGTYSMSGDSFFVGGYGSTNLDTTQQFWGAQFEKGNTVTIYEATGISSPTAPGNYNGPGTPINNGAMRSASDGTIYITGPNGFDEVTYNPNTGTRTNFIDDTPSFPAWGFSGGTLTANTDIAPDGTKTAWTATENIVNTQHYINKAAVLSTANTIYTFSIYIKPPPNFDRQININLTDATAVGGNSYATWAWNFRTQSVPNGYPNITSNGTLSGVLGGIIPSVNGWYRIYVSTRFSTVLAYIQARLQTVLLDGGNPYAGDGSTNYLVWGPQIEKGNTPGILVNTVAGTGAPNPNFIARTSSNGDNYIVGEYDEVSYNPNSGYIRNLIYNSSSLTTAIPRASDSFLTANAAIAPDGTKTAALWYENTSGNGRYAEGFYYNDIGMTSNFNTTIPYTWSIYVKASGRNVCTITLYPINTNAYLYANFNLTTGQLIGSGAGPAGTSNFISAAITKFSDGWYRVSVSGIPDNTGLTNSFYSMRIQSVSGNFQGDGKSGLLLWGPQFEKSSSPTSYIATGSNGIPLLQ